MRRVAWLGEDVALGDQALERIAACRQSFLALLEAEPDLVVYGVTSGYGERASVRLSPEERKAQAARAPYWADASYGPPVPERVARAIVLARLANFVEGHAAVRPELAQAVAAMLNGQALPELPAQGHGDAGEIVALSRLFAEVGANLGLEEKEALALVNGSPCAAALLADAALAGRNRLNLAEQAFALSVEALGAPLEAYAPELEELWGDEHEAAALRALRALLQGASPERRGYQAPVSYRILPRVLGEARRALAAVEHAAEISLRSVTDNPVYMPPDSEHPHGRVWSTGGYHNGQAYPALDRLAATWVNLCLLCERHAERLVLGTDMAVPQAWSRALGVLLMIQVGHSEEARTAAQPTFLPRGGFPQNDVTAPSFLAWNKEETAGARLDSSLAMLAALAAHALDDAGRKAPPPLQRLVDEVDEHVTRGRELRPLSPEIGSLAEALRSRVYDAAG